MGRPYRASGPRKYFLHGFLVGLASWVWVTAAHVSLYDAYVAGTPPTLPWGFFLMAGTGREWTGEDFQGAIKGLQSAR